MHTLRLRVDVKDIYGPEFRQSIQRAAEILKGGGLVAFPTETVYGLGANALQSAAVSRIFEAKQRPAWDPLIAHISGRAMLDQVARDLGDCALRLMDAYWPGPLTLLVPRHSQVPLIVTAGRERVGVRMPAHPVALALIRQAGVPIAAPSANTFGHVSPTTAAHVLEDLDGRIDAVLDGGSTLHGLESTVVDTCEAPPLIYRPGVVSLAQVAAVCGEARQFSEVPSGARLADPTSESGSRTEAHPAPGLGMRHYAPRAHLLLFEGEGEAQRTSLFRALAEARAQGERVGLMVPDEFAAGLSTMSSAGCLVFRWGGLGHPEELARRLFAGLRELDLAGATVILCPLPQTGGIGEAIRDRLRKAAR